MSALRPARLSGRDVVRVGASGLRTRPVRVFLSALGIAIGIATMVAVIGISASSKEQLLRRLDTLGTNMLTVSAGKSLFGKASKLPEASLPMVKRIQPVQTAAATGNVDATVRRTPKIDKEVTGGLAVQAASPELLTTLGGMIAKGSWLNAPGYPEVILGSEAAKRLGVDRTGVRVWIGGGWFTVLGVLEPAPLAPELDSSALVGWPVAERLLSFDGHPTTIYERSREDAVAAVGAVLAATVNPQAPEEVTVSRPSDALAAQAAADSAFTGLLLGLGAVALLVGGVGVANTMVIAVLERRAEIGLRRALGATRRHVRDQFVAEALVLSGLGGSAGVLLGSAVTAAYALSRGWPVSVPGYAWVGALLATLLVGGLAGLYPAVRASRLSPVTALAAA